MRLFNLVVSGFLNIVVVSFAVASNSNESMPGSQDERIKSRLQSAYPIRCANLNECPSWVVGIVTHQGGAASSSSAQGPQGVQQSRVGVCSGSLVAPDIVATNLHCLPNNLTMRDQPCGDVISFQFPKTNTEPVLNVGCEKVLALSPPLEGDFLRSDYAFLKLATPVRGRSPVSVSTEGISDLTRMTIYKIDPTPLGPEPGSGMEGIVKKLECKAIQGSIMNPYYQSQTSPLVMLSPCPIIKGNSGSGMIADDGTLRGLVSSFGELLVPEKLKKKLKEQVEKFESASGTNMSCVPWPVGEGNVPKSEDCRVQTDEKTRQKLVDTLLKTEIQKSLDEINSKVNKQFKSFELAGSQLFFWQVIKAELAPDERDTGIMARAKVRPMCLLPEISSILDYKTKLKSQVVLIPMKVSDYLVRERFDAYLRYQALVEEKVHNFKAKLVPRDLLREKNIEITLLFDDGNTETEEKYKLNLCYAREKIQSGEAKINGKIEN